MRERSKRKKLLALRRRGRPGFTLIEVMVAMGILTVGMLGTLPLITRALNQSVHGRKVTAAQYAGNAVLDQLRFEVRHDPNPTAAQGCGGSTGCANGKAFELGSAWQADRLPHLPGEKVVGDDDCNPPGTEDGITYEVGPFPLRFENNTYSICYLLEPTTTADAPPGSLDARVKVFWPSPIGFGSRSISTVLLAGRP